MTSTIIETSKIKNSININDQTNEIENYTLMKPKYRKD